MKHLAYENEHKINHCNKKLLNCQKPNNPKQVFKV